MILTKDELRRIVFVTSVAYADALCAGRSVQRAEWERSQRLDDCLSDLADDAARSVRALITERSFNDGR